MIEMEREDIFRLVKYSFIAAIAILLIFIFSFFIMFHTFYDIEESAAVTVGGPGATNEEQVPSKLTAKTRMTITDSTGPYSIANGSPWDISLRNEIPTKGEIFDALQTYAIGFSVKATKSVDQTISNSVSTIITWDQEGYDTDGMHDNVTNNSRITVQTAGKYSVTAQYEWESDSTGKRIIDIMKNSVAVGKTNYLASGNSQHIISFIGDLAVDDILEVRVFQNSGGDLNFLTNITYFEAHKIN